MKRRTGGTKLWATLSKQATRSARQFSRTVTKTVTDPMMRAAKQQSQAVSKAMGRAVGKVARQALTGVVTPARAPVSKGGGCWEEGQWGFTLGIGRMAQRRYRIFVPPGVTAARPAPLLVLLHGCGQDAASFAACARVATVARDARWVVLMPEQSVQANAHRCWNWFRPAARGASETALLMSMIDHVSQRYAILANRVCAFGLSAGGAMAMMLGLRYPDRFAAIGSHSGAAHRHCCCCMAMKTAWCPTTTPRPRRRCGWSCYRPARRLPWRCPPGACGAAHGARWTCSTGRPDRVPTCAW